MVPNVTPCTMQDDAVKIMYPEIVVEYVPFSATRVATVVEAFSASFRSQTASRLFFWACSPIAVCTDSSTPNVVTGAINVPGPRLLPNPSIAVIVAALEVVGFEPNDRAAIVAVFNASDFAVA